MLLQRLVLAGVLVGLLGLAPETPLARAAAHDQAPDESGGATGTARRHAPGPARERPDHGVDPHLQRRRPAPPTAALDILVAIQEFPGINYRALMQMTCLGNGTVSHHIRALELSHTISSLTFLNRTHYFVGEVPENARAAVVLQSPTTRRVLAFASWRQAFEQRDAVSDLGQHAGMGRSAVRKHLARLVEAGLLVEWNENRRKMYAVAGTGASTWADIASRGHAGSADQGATACGGP